MTGALFILMCLAVSFTFTGIEAGILSVNRVRLRHHSKHGDRAARSLERMLEHPRRLLLTVLVVTNVANITALVLITDLAVGNCGKIGYVYSLLLALPVWLLGLGLLPKALFRRFPYRALVRLSVLIQAAHLLLAPVFYLVEWLTIPFAGRRLTPGIGMILARDELKFVTGESARLGVIRGLERDIIHSIVDFRNLRGKDVMVNWSDVISAPETSTAQQLVDLARQHDLDRIPITAESGAVVGLVQTLDVLLDYRPRQTAARYLRRIVQALPDDTAHRIVRRLRAARLTLAAICDPDGTPLGIVSTHDLVQRIVEKNPEAA